MDISVTETDHSVSFCFFFFSLLLDIFFSFSALLLATGLLVAGYPLFLELSIPVIDS